VIFSDLNNDGLVNEEDSVTAAGLFVIASDAPTLCEDLAGARFFPFGANSLFFFLEQFDVCGAGAPLTFRAETPSPTAALLAEPCPLRSAWSLPSTRLGF
jgi:hypothetical protein